MLVNQAHHQANHQANRRENARELRLKGMYIRRGLTFKSTSHPKSLRGHLSFKARIWSENDLHSSWSGSHCLPKVAYFTSLRPIAFNGHKVATESCGQAQALMSTLDVEFLERERKERKKTKIKKSKNKDEDKERKQSYRWDGISTILKVRKIACRLLRKIVTNNCQSWTTNVTTGTGFHKPSRC